MAISKILNMKDCGGHFHGKHLKRALDYVMNPDKTQDGRLVGAINCQVDTAFEQMKETKRNFGKIDKRQGHHIILSFKENEVNPDTAFEITQKFVEEYLGKSYEAVFVVHDNTAHVHSHIVFNSVSFVDGKKYRYEKGDWAKYIQPITNRLCQEYGLSIIDVDDEKKERQHESYKEWSEYREGNFVWSDMIKRDLDACILQAKDYEEFLELLSEKGYQIKQGKHLAIKPQGMTRFRRCKSLGDMYCEEAIRDRIVKEDIAFYKSKQDIPKVSIVKCRVKRYRRAGLSGLQKKHYAKLYRVGKLKKRPYSQVWKYREDIRKMHKLQEQYLFLARHNIHSAEELVGTIASLTDKKKETSAEKSRIYKARERSRELFTAADEMENLKPAEQSYRLGDTFFEDEHRKWVALEQELQAQGYSLEEVQALQFKTEDMRKVERMAKKYGILYSVLPDCNKTDGMSEVIFHTEAVPRVNMMIQKLKFGRIATFDDYLKNGDEKSLGKLMDFLRKQQGNEKSHTVEGDKVNSAIDGLIEKVGMFAMEKQAISVEQVKENFSINGEQAENVIKQLETIGVLGGRSEDGTHKVMMDKEAFTNRIRGYQSLADRMRAISASKNTNLSDVTISKKLIAEENDHAVKTRVPGTWGKDVRYVWLHKENVMDIHNGKTMLTFLDTSKDCSGWFFPCGTVLCYRFLFGKYRCER